MREEIITAETHRLVQEAHDRGGNEMRLVTIDAESQADHYQKLGDEKMAEARHMASIVDGGRFSGKKLQQLGIDIGHLAGVAFACHEFARHIRNMK